VRDRIPFRVRYDGDSVVVTDIGEGSLEGSDETKGSGKKSQNEGGTQEQLPLQTGDGC